MIQIRIGVRGQGKTARDVELILDGLRCGRGQATNYDVHPQFDYDPRLLKRFTTLEQLIGMIEREELMHFDVHIDEIQHYMNSRRWADLPPEMMMAICESRKYDLNVFGTVQYIQRLDVAVREQVDEIFVVSRYPFGICHEVKWTRPFVDPNGTVVWESENAFLSFLHPARWYRINEEIKFSYNTFERISQRKNKPILSYGS